MASFSFGAGNARKLARIPLYALGRAATLIIPRGRRWAFGCGAGVADGGLAVWTAARAHGIDGIWLTTDAAEAAEAERRGMRHAPKMSWRGFWATARARAIVVTHGLGDVNPYAVSGAVVAQLWHGIPLKRIGLDAPEMVRSSFLPSSELVRRLIAFLYRRSARRIDVLPAASHLVRGRLESAFGLPDGRIAVTGEPRVDALSIDDAGTREQRARALIAAAQPRLAEASRPVLYAPTWRDGEPDPAQPTADEWRRIVDVLERRDATLVVRSHRLGEGSYEPPFETERVVPLGSDLLADITPALPAFAALVTDYSSLVYDSALVPLPVLFLAPDVEEYAERRGFYGDYAEIAGEDVPRTWGQLAPRLDALLSDDSEIEAARDRARRLSARVHDFRDGQNTQRALRAILAKLPPTGKDRAE
ncbi:CDP-glycerol glycerophosphotransferase family protein [Microbacterium sp. gxy059]|uniref:CDP-glycerol glycerophosphotransferase family protein n=1 Tax=Microbacterium sp. gxy059 TaxID=2957199 RepID=UPI003D968833